MAEFTVGGATVSIPFSRPDISECEIAEVTQVLRSGKISMGAQTAAFENAIAALCGSRHAVMLTSGTAALHLGLLAVDTRPGQTVITSPFTYVATVNAILQAGATPVFVDIDPLTYNIDVEQVANAVTDTTHAILPVHVFGGSTRMDKLAEVAQRFGLRVIEDSCEALGSKYRGRPLGTWGDAGGFGFFANKQITTAEGGALVTDSGDLAELVRSMRHQGRSFDGRGYVRLGFNYKPSDIHAALGLAQLHRLPEIFARRRQVMQWYRSALNEVDEVALPGVFSEAEVEWFVCVVRLDKTFGETQRDFIMRSLTERGIEVANYFPALHLQPYFAERLGYRAGDFPVAEHVAGRTVALPYFSTMTEDEVQRVVAELKSALHKAKRIASF
jgi:perosamine synthetase